MSNDYKRRNSAYEMTKSYEMEQKGIRKNFIYQNVNKKQTTNGVINFSITQIILIFGYCAIRVIRTHVLSRKSESLLHSYLLPIYMLYGYPPQKDNLAPTMDDMANYFP